MEKPHLPRHKLRNLPLSQKKEEESQQTHFQPKHSLQESSQSRGQSSQHSFKLL